MKVLEINSCSGCLSTGKIASDLALELEKAGKKAVVAYARSYVDTGIKVYKIGSSLDIYLHALQTRFFDNSGFGSKRATRKFIAWAKEYDPDVVHLHNIHGYYLNIELLFEYIKLANKRVVWTLHDCWPFTGHCAYFSFVNCGQWKTNCLQCPQIKSYPASYFRDNCKNNFSSKRKAFTGVKNMTIVTPSKWLAELVKQSFLVEYPVKVINNGIDTEVFCPTESDFREKYRLNDKKILLGVASIWDKRKGLPDFIELSKSLDESYQIVLIGLNKNQITELPKNIIGIPRTNSAKELAGIYTTSDVFINTTYEDNYPTVNLEAQACNTPVITYRSGGSVESVPPENVVGQGDIKAVLELLKTRQKIKQFDFNRKRMLMEYMDIYNNCEEKI